MRFFKIIVTLLALLGAGALMADPSSPPADYYQLLANANGLLTDGKLDEARKAADQAIAANPSDYLAYTVAAKIAAAQGNAAQAKKYLDKAFNAASDTDKDKVRQAAGELELQSPAAPFLPATKPSEHPAAPAVAVPALRSPAPPTQPTTKFVERPPTTLSGEYKLGDRMAEESGEAVVVVYNPNVRESIDVADHYAELRHVPETQIVGFKMTTNEVMSRPEYEKDLEGPLRHFLDDQKLLIFEPAASGSESGARRVKVAKIRYVVLCYGVPLKIGGDGTLKEADEERLRPELRRNDAAVDSELCLLPWPKARMLAGYEPNILYSALRPEMIDPTNGLLIVARLDGPTAEIARGLVDKAVVAETNGLWGRAYFDLRDLPKNDGLRKGDDWISDAAKAAHDYGFETVVDDRPELFSAGFPMSQIALYAGWYIEHASGPFTQTGVEFMPGAFAYHLHSYSARTVRSTTQNWCGPLLAKGATCTMGCVEEPYLDGTPNIGFFMRRWLAGFTFGEAAYASQGALSWQTTVIGDPLFRPFGRDPRQVHESLLARHSPMVQWSFLRVVNLSLVHGTSPAKMVDFLNEIDATNHSAVLTEKLGDLFQLRGQPDRAINCWERALQLQPSPLQAVRLKLETADRLADTDQDEKALALYQEFLSQDPDYPDALALYQKMEPLAKHLHKRDLAKNYAKEIARLSAK